ncbi:DUF5597 domain-containing protein [Asticcacaulis sp. EMRT-3]|uniref:DUF5597 domain-containing protein n=1 Tax=Asticcacaulis sp. EMRT-3 TaxID=3040349 RepID=UPI0024AFCFBB|nr:DUF5597 domain-containing protein [Asticcacaulis sp. EMRT-3]MDI7774005.1 DUF5597 domain-containing protein [Asticcacaulis sp. EMRT-3]
MGLWKNALLATALIALSSAPALAADQMPQLVSKDGRFALMVDGAPYLMLAGQANNSSNYPAVLPKVWPAIEDMKANTLVMPVAWEQIEPKEGQFDFSFVDTLVDQARQHHVHLVILWFGTWKNTGPSYTPSWVKTDNKRFPRLTNKDGSTSYALSPLYDSTREADKRAYVELVKHIKAIDGEQHTILMLQVENETGVYRTARDYSKKADALMDKPVPPALIKAMGKRALKASGNWHEVFGDDADEYFQAWSVATYCDDIAAAGKAIYPLPTYMNDALKDPLNPAQTPGSYASGGPSYNVLDIYKVAAPHIDILAPDLYSPGSDSYEATLNLYARPDNALLVAESGNTALYARYLFTALGHRAIGFDPFGFDYTGYSNYPLGAKATDKSMVEPFANLYGVFAPMARIWAKLSFSGQVWGVSEPDDHAAQSLDLGPEWSAKVTYRQWQFGLPEWDPEHKSGYPEGSDVPSGGVAVAKLADNQYLVIGHNARITFDNGPKNADKGFLMSRVEEGHFDDQGNWVFERVWNGDETDYGLNFVGKPVILKVTLATYEK